MRRLAVIVVPLLAVCAPARHERPAPMPAPQAVSARDPVEVAHDLSLLATGMPASAADLETLASAGHSRAAFAKYIDELVKRPAVANVASGLLRIPGSPDRSVIGSPILKQQADGTYYLHATCELAQAVSVKPWWDLSTTVRVCPAAYRPDVFKTTDGNYCSGVYAGPRTVDSPCGCGPNLMRCLRSEADRDAFKKAIYRESVGTLGYVIEHDLPIQTIFTSVESFRLPHAELLYQRWLVENRDVPSLEALPDWRAWPKDGQWAPRPASRPNEHAGIFTNHYTPQQADSQRMKLVMFYETVWCESPDSLRVKTETVLDIAKTSGANLRGTVKVGPNELAARPLCTDCHARIDYGVQFFAGIQWHYKSLHYVSDAQTDAEGELYRRDITDLRGKAPRNPQGFVKIALAQPEFPACMAHDFMRHAFANGADPTLDPLETKLRAVVERKGTYRELLKLALDEYANRALAMRPAAAIAHVSEDQRSKAVADFVGQRCDACHGEDAEVPSRVIKDGAAWCAKSGADCAKIGVQMLDAVVFDRMPKDEPLSAADKRQLFDLISPLVWRVPETRAQARRYFIENAQSPAVHRMDAMTSWIRSVGGASASTPLPPTAAELQFSVTSAVELSITAADVCAKAADKQACLDKAMNRDAFEK